VTWVRIDDHFDEHPKLAAVGPIGWGVWLAGLAYSNRNLTDGFIPYSVAEGIGGNWQVRIPVENDEDREQVWDIARGSGMHGEDMDTSWVIDLLLLNGLWERCAGGYRVHDYDDYQPTKAEVMAMRQQKAAAGRAGGLAARRQARAKADAQPPAEASAATPAEAESKPIPIPTPTPVPEVHSNVLSTADLDFIEPWQLFEERTRRTASQKVRDWLEDLHARFSRRELLTAMKVVPGPRESDWLKKVDAYLEGAA
jgi:hypothetical protein